MELVPYRAQNLGASDGRPNFSPVDRSSTYSNSSRPPQKETLVESPPTSRCTNRSRDRSCRERRTQYRDECSTEPDTHDDKYRRFKPAHS
jgi:hypothetical protein